LRRNGSKGWVPEKKEQLGPTRVRDPMVRTRVDKGAVAVDEDAFTESGVACSQLGEFWPLNRKVVVPLRVGGTT
jgi:hypothetical protein